jgi:polyphosphate kinase 2 (PPK2 family)
MANTKTTKGQTSNGRRASATTRIARKQSAAKLDPIAQSLVDESMQAARITELSAFESVLHGPPALNADSAPIKAMLDGAAPDDAKLMKALIDGKTKPDKRHTSDELADNWRQGGYPYKFRMYRKDYEEQKFILQTELLKLQNWMKDARQRLVLLFEGRDAAGKGGTIKRFMEHLNPRGARVVALDKPSDVERGQWYFQRYVEHLPTSGEIVLFDRSWYNRAGVERVMGFCSQAEYEEFLRQVPEFERNLVRSGLHIIKFWFSVSRGRAAPPLQGARGASAEAVEAVPDRHGLARQMGRLHPRQGGDVLLHRHRRLPVDGDQVRRQEARPAERNALRAALPALCRQGRLPHRPRRRPHRRPRQRHPRARGACELRASCSS